MSTRSYICLKKGNEYRACFVHWCGDRHDETFRKMSNFEVTDLWLALGTAAGRNDQSWLDHFYTTKDWNKRVKEAVNEAVSTKREAYYGCQLLPQLSAYYPTTPQMYDPMCQYRTIAVFNSKTMGHDIGDLLKKAASKKAHKPLDQACVEYGWVFDIETNEIWCSCDKLNDWAWTKVKPRKKKSK